MTRKLLRDRRRFLLHRSLDSRAASGPLILEYFTDTEGTPVASHVISPINTPLTSWTVRLGTWVIESNKAGVTTLTDYAHITCDPGVADCVITADIAQIATSLVHPRNSGILCRWSDTSNYWSAVFNNTGAGNHYWWIVERNAGTDTIRATYASGNWIDGTEHELIATLDGTTITATIDGDHEITYASATLNQAATVHGVRGYMSTNFSADNFKVENLP